MDIAEHLLKIKAVVNELEKLIAYASPLSKDLYFDPSVRLHAATTALVIEADRIGNLEEQNIDVIVAGWISDCHWESHL